MTQDQTLMNWWQNFFHGIALDLWRAAVSPEQTVVDADFLEEQLQVSKGARLLDVPCGNGRLSLALAERGYILTGVDIASEFIEEAKAKAVADNLQIDWHLQNMRDLPWQEKFDGAFCFGNSFAYLDDADNEIFLRSVARSLKPGARFIVDTHASAETILPGFAPHRSFEVGDITLTVDNHYDHEQSRMFTDYHFIRDGKDDCRPGSQRIYSYYELKKLLQSCGIPIEKAYGSLAKEPFQLGANSLILICKK